MRLAHMTVDQLKVLPLRAIVAFAARCARRVEPLAQLPEGDPRREGRRQAVEAALLMAEAFARGSDAPPDESVVAAVDAISDAGGESAGPAAVSAVAQAAHATSSAWHAGFRLEGKIAATAEHPAQVVESPSAFAHVTADIAAMNAFTAAADAFLSVGHRNEAFVGAGLRDYQALVRLGLGRYPDLGAPVDPSPDGPLGPL
jgi:hypothetical protein